MERLAALEAPEKEVIRRYVNAIQIQRGDFNGKVITIRREDVSALGRVFERGHWAPSRSTASRIAFSVSFMALSTSRMSER